jgi:hypothetical protein
MYHICLATARKTYWHRVCTPQTKGKKIHDLFRVSKAFFLKFHIFVNCHGYSEVTTTNDQQKQYVYCNYTASEIAIGSGMDWGLFKTFVLSTSAMNYVHSDSQLPWSCW